VQAAAARAPASEEPWRQSAEEKHELPPAPDLATLLKAARVRAALAQQQQQQQQQQSVAAADVATPPPTAPASSTAAARTVEEQLALLGHRGLLGQQPPVPSFLDDGSARERAQQRDAGALSQLPMSQWVMLLQQQQQQERNGRDLFGHASAAAASQALAPSLVPGTGGSVSLAPPSAAGRGSGSAGTGQLIEALRQEQDAIDLLLARLREQQQQH
jgi:hypothetical protein